LLAFGRFSADSELTAARASGVSLVSLAAPILMFGLFLCVVCAVINMKIAPTCRVAYNDLRSDVRAEMASAKLPEGQAVDFPPTKPGDAAYTIFARKNRNQNLQDVLVYEMEDKTNSRTVLAPSGFLEVDTNGQRLILNLTNATSSIFPGGLSFFGNEAQFIVDLASDNKGTVGITDMTFGQLREEMRKRRVSPPIPISTNSVADPLTKKRLVHRTTIDFMEPIRIQMHKEVAFSFACFGFTLIGIPLGIRMHRRETNVGVFIALVLVLIYYTVQVFGQSLASHAEYAPHLLMWVPNLIFQAVGAVLLWRANRGI
jgi:lipopolysaccharide export system permease protein